MKLTEKTMNVVKKESEVAINQMAEGKKTIEIAGEIYCKALPNKDVETGKVMAKRIDSIICDYEKMLSPHSKIPKSGLRHRLKSKSKERNRRTLQDLVLHAGWCQLSE